MAFKLMELYAQVSERGVAATGRAIDGLHVKASRVDRAMDAMASKVKWAFAIAIPAAIVYSIKAFAVQEKATNSLRAALDAHGDSVEAMLPRL